MDIFTNITKIIESIGIIISSIFVFIKLLKTLSFSKGRILKGKYLHYKTIREEYFKNQNNGYFLLQQYFKRYLPKDEMEHILNSSDAYKAFSFLMAGRGKCEFKDNEYTLKDANKGLILWYIGYFISFLLIASNIVFADCILPKIGTYNFFVISIINLCITVPFFIMCVMTINDIACAKNFEGRKEKEKKQRKWCKVRETSNKE